MMNFQKLNQAYKKCLLTESFQDIDTSTYMFKSNIICPKCNSVHINLDDEKQPDFPMDEDEQTKIYYTCGDCNCHFNCTLKPVVTDIQIQED